MRIGTKVNRRMRRRASYAWLLVLAAAAVAALASAGAGSAASPGSADLRISKADSPDPVSVGSTLTYTLLVEDRGPDVATGVTVVDQLPKGVDFVSATATSGTCTQAAKKATKVTCELGTIGASAGVYAVASTVTIVVIPRKIGTIGNTASVKGDQKDPVSANDKATATTRVVGPPATCRGVIATVVGTAGNDILTGTGGGDVIAAFGGDDTIVSLAGRDLVCAGNGDDYVGAGSAADRVYGAGGADRLAGHGGPDVLRGSAGDDILNGNRGADRLRGGRGFDRCRGGAGMDSIRGCER